MSTKVTITQQPPPISLLDDGVIFSLRSLLDFAGTAATLTIMLSDAYGDYPGNSFSLAFMGNELEFSFVDSPDQSGLQLSLWDPQENFASFAASLVLGLNQNHLFNRYYYAELLMSAPEGRMLITSKLPGAEYSIYLDACSVPHMFAYTQADGNDSSIPEDFRIYVAPYRFDANPIVASSLGEELLAVDDQNLATVDLATYFNKYIITSFVFPFNGSYSRVLPDAVLKFFIKYSDFYHGAVHKLSNTYGDSRYLIRGGLNRMDSSLLNGPGFNYFDYKDNLLKFLTHAPLSKVTYPQVPEFLYFLMTGSSGATCQLKLVNADGTQSTQSFALIAPENQYRIIELSVGISDLCFNQDISGILSYDIWLEDDKGSLLSEVRSFVIDHSYYENKRVLIFQNSFDVYESVCCTGDMQLEDSYTRTQVEFLNGRFVHSRLTDVERQLEYSLNSGWLADKDTRQWLTEVLLSKDSFFQLGQVLLPVVISNKQSTILKDRQNLYSLKLSFSPDFTDSRYSSIVGEGAFFLMNENGMILLNENEIGLIAE